VFVNTKRDAEKVWSYIEGNDRKAAILSGDVPQKKRQSLLKKFQEGELAVLVATDVAARGLHIPDVSHVFNYDLPQDAEDYVHRIGRTARLGADGDAITFACERFVYSLPDIETYIGHSIPVERVTDDMLATPRPPVKRPQRKAPPGRGQRSGRDGRGASGRGGGRRRSTS
jgi:ATP-dependent RNA helicase RhlB